MSAYPVPVVQKQPLITFQPAKIFLPRLQWGGLKWERTPFVVALLTAGCLSICCSLIYRSFCELTMFDTLSEYICWHTPCDEASWCYQKEIHANHVKQFQMKSRRIIAPFLQSFQSFSIRGLLQPIAIFAKGHWTSATLTAGSGAIARFAEKHRETSHFNMALPFTVESLFRTLCDS